MSGEIEPKLAEDSTICANLVLIYKRDRGYYRDKCRGYAYLDGAGLFTRERAEEEARREDTIQVVEPAEVWTAASGQLADLERRCRKLREIIALASSPDKV